ncbi:type II secretion system protein GspL [Zobellella sp. DQSA1]|uniref:type II secretion system protein GspL n=1 Tax=Zobellella sp. DQSA1 TaxID=3342386 RepID=UPI0035C24C46
MSSKPSGEQLVVRLPADDCQPVLWLHGTENGDIVAQGSLQPGVSDPALAALSVRLPTRVLIPASECVFHRVLLPPRARRRVRQVVPFMLEEQVATDIERLHFAVLMQNREHCHVAVVDKSHMRRWLACCEQLGLRMDTLLPDALMLPPAAAGWSAVRLDDQWLFRREHDAGMAVESCWLPELLSAWPEPVVIHSYSTPPAGETLAGEWHALPEQALLQLAATQPLERGKDLRQGEFAQGKVRRQPLRPWKAVIFALSAYLLLLTGEAGLAHYRLWQQAEHWRQETVRVYRQLLPQETHVVNPRAQMQQRLRQLETWAQTPGLGIQIRRLQSLFAQNSAVTLHALAYDAARAEIRLELQANAYQELEAFQHLAEQHYRLRPGEMKQGGGRVESQLVLEVKP